MWTRMVGAGALGFRSRLSYVSCVAADAAASNSDAYAASHIVLSVASTGVSSSPAYLNAPVLTREFTGDDP